MRKAPRRYNSAKAARKDELGPLAGSPASGAMPRGTTSARGKKKRAANDVDARTIVASNPFDDDLMTSHAGSAHLQIMLGPPTPQQAPPPAYLTQQQHSPQQYPHPQHQMQQHHSPGPNMTPPSAGSLNHHQLQLHRPQPHHLQQQHPQHLHHGAAMGHAPQPLPLPNQMYGYPPVGPPPPSHLNYAPPPPGPLPPQGPQPPTHQMGPSPVAGRGAGVTPGGPLPHHNLSTPPHHLVGDPSVMGGPTPPPPPQVGLAPSRGPLYGPPGGPSPYSGGLPPPSQVPPTSYSPAPPPPTPPHTLHSMHGPAPQPQPGPVPQPPLDQQAGQPGHYSAQASQLYCGECRQMIYAHEARISCRAGCDTFYHRLCSGLSEMACDMLLHEPAAEWVCNKCVCSDRRIPVIRDATDCRQSPAVWM